MNHKLSTLHLTLYIFIFNFLVSIVTPSYNLNAADDGSNSSSNSIILNAIWEKLYQRPLVPSPNISKNDTSNNPKSNSVKNSKNYPINKNPPSSNPSNPPSSNHNVANNIDSSLVNPVTKIVNSGSGNNYVQAQLEKNRQILRARTREQQETAKEAAQLKEDSSFNISSSSSYSDNSSNNQNFSKEMHKQEQNFLNAAKDNVQNTYKKWKQEVDQTYADWHREHLKFLKRIDTYKNNLSPINPIFDVNSKSTSKPASGSNESNSAINKMLHPSIVSSEQILERVKNPPNKSYKYHIVKDALSVPVRDQEKRATCSAFAGIHAIQILMQQQGRDQDLSEQYFYFASRPDCQKFPCNNRGSWVVPGFEYSKQQGRLDIPLLEKCPYQGTSITGNETQIPLASGCQQGGVVAVAEYRELYTLNEVKRALDEDHPVIGGFSLSDDFYSTSGIVITSDRTLVKSQNASHNTKSANYISKRISSDDLNTNITINTSNDLHAKGHTLVIVGHLEMPSNNPSYSQQGEVCFLVANSWGVGFGQGGHACLSESWIIEHRLRNPFVELVSIRMSTSKYFL